MPKNKIIQIRIDDIDYKKFKREAAKFGLTVSAYWRMIAYQHMQNEQRKAKER